MLRSVNLIIMSLGVKSSTPAGSVVPGLYKLVGLWWLMAGKPKAHNLHFTPCCEEILETRRVWLPGVRFTQLFHSSRGTAGLMQAFHKDSMARKRKRGSSDGSKHTFLSKSSVVLIDSVPFVYKLSNKIGDYVEHAVTHGKIKAGSSRKDRRKTLSSVTNQCCKKRPLEPFALQHWTRYRTETVMAAGRTGNSLNSYPKGPSTQTQGMYLKP